MPDIVHGSQLPFKALGFKHRVGEPEFKTLFTHPSPLSPNNYFLALAQQRAFYSPVHKHNFEQFRYAYRGPFSIGPSLTIAQNELCYHPEGVEYGPQDDPEDGVERVLLILQFGGASGQGFLGYDSLLKVQKELGENGVFKGGKYFVTGEGKGVGVGGDEKGVDGFQACWERVHGRKLVYPEPRYAAPVLMRAGAFGWVEEKGGVKRKLLGSFTERGTRAEMLRLEAGGRCVVEGVERAVQFLFVKEGSGSVGSERVETESAVRLAPGEGATFSSEKGLEMLRLVIPQLKE